MKVLDEKRVSGVAVSIVDERYNRKTDVLMSPTEALGAEASLAMRLIEKWGVVAGEIDGEDSTGRQRLRRMTPQELVTEACDTAALTLQEIRKRGWSVEVLSPRQAEELFHAQATVGN